MLPSLLISLSLSFRRVVTFTWHFVLHLTLTFLRLFLVFIQHAENSIRRNLIFIRVLAGMLGERAPKGICARVLPSSVIHQRHIYVREFPFATQPFFLALCVCVWYQWNCHTERFKTVQYEHSVEHFLFKSKSEEETENNGKKSERSRAF